MESNFKQDKIAHQELELLMGKLYNGDDTYAVYTLLKDTPYKQTLIDTLRGRTNVHNQKQLQDLRKSSRNGFSFDSWFRSGRKLNT